MVTWSEPRSGLRIAFGGDYNPEQWPQATLEEDVALMHEAGVNLVTVGVFSWALLEPEPGRYELGWLDRVMDRLAEEGIGVDLATATASPPPWLSHRHPEVLPVTAEGYRLWPGSRQTFCPSSPVYRERALALCRVLAERYGTHPGLRMWHVANEIGNHNALCYCDLSATAFRAWLKQRYGDVEALNRAWATTFWSQRYGDLDEVLPPRATASSGNPTQRLDFQRFSSDELLDNFLAERDLLHDLSPGVPVTTNFMVMSRIRDMDYHRWGPEVDVVSNDHYLDAEDPFAHEELAFCSDLVRGTSEGRPWVLMENSTSAVNWQPRNLAKRPGEMTRNAVQHLGRGADGILYFQWRASVGGAEKFHSALVPHAGTRTRVWHEVVELGDLLGRLSEVVGSTVSNDIAILHDYQARWAAELDAHPSVDVGYLDVARDLHRILTARGFGVDVVHPDADLSAYRVVMVPTLYLVDPSLAPRLRSAAEAGAAVVVTYFSGIVDDDDHVLPGGYPGAFRDLVGAWAEEFRPLPRDGSVRLDDGSWGRIWSEHVHLVDADAVVRYAERELEGLPAVTRVGRGAGTAWYVSTRLDDEALDRLVGQVLEASGAEPLAATSRGVELTRRHRADGQSWTFVVNHTDVAAEVAVAGHNLVTDAATGPTTHVPAGGVAIVRAGAGDPR